MKITIASVLIAIGAIAFALMQTRERSAEQAELGVLRITSTQVVERVVQLEAENKTLRQQNSQLASQAQAASPNEIAKLRADSTELRRARTELAQATQTIQTLKNNAAAQAAQFAQAQQAGRLAPVASQPNSGGAAAGTVTGGTNEFRGYSFDGNAQLGFGHTIVMGGWQMPGGKRLYAFVTPSQDASGNILLQPKLAEVTDSAAQAAGLNSLASDSKDAGKFLVNTPEAAATAMRTLQNSGGIDILTAPSVLVQPGTTAEIKMLNEAGLGSVFTFVPRLQPGGQGLDMSMAIRHQPKP